MVERTEEFFDEVFCVEIEPMGKKSVRFGNGHSYKHPDQRKWEKEFANQARIHLPDKPLDGPVRLDFLAVFPRPQYMLFRYKKSGLFKYPKGLIWYDKKPDSDNVRKSIKDAMKDFWTDDCKVVFGASLKAYAEIGGSARILVRLRAGRMLPQPHLAARELGLL